MGKEVSIKQKNSHCDSQFYEIPRRGPLDDQQRQR